MCQATTSSMVMSFSMEWNSHFMMHLHWGLMQCTIHVRTRRTLPRWHELPAQLRPLLQLLQSLHTISTTSTTFTTSSSITSTSFTAIATTPCTTLSTTGPTVALHQLCARGCILGQMLRDRHPLQPCGPALPAVLRLRPREGLRPLRHDPSPCIISYYVDFYHNSTIVNNTLANSFYCYDFNPATSEDLQGAY